MSKLPLPSPQNLPAGQHELILLGSSADIPVFLPAYSSLQSYITAGCLPGESLPLGQEEKPTFLHCLFLSCLYLESTAYYTGILIRMWICSSQNELKALKGNKAMRFEGTPCFIIPFAIEGSSIFSNQ